MADVRTNAGRQIKLDLGHPLGVQCPFGHVRPKARIVTIVHDHGIHDYPVNFCACPESLTDQAMPDALQLIRHGLWPGSWRKPLTAFTVSVLRDHQLLSLQAQMSTHDYFEYLRRTTNMVSPEDASVSSSRHLMSA